MNIRALDPADVGYAFFTFREGVKKAPGLDRLPWSYFRDKVEPTLKRIIDDPDNVLLGAYTAGDALLGWLVMTPGKRVSVLHWVHTKHKLDGRPVRRQGVMTALIGASGLGRTFAYSFRARRDRAKLPDGSTTKSLDESLVLALRARGMNATYIPQE